jgi:hypothetical protein
MMSAFGGWVYHGRDKGACFSQAWEKATTAGGRSMPPVEIAIFVALFILPLAAWSVAIAARTYSSLAAGPWWRLPRPRLARSLVLNVLAYLGGAAALALVLVVTGRVPVNSSRDFPQAWTGAFEANLILFVLGLLLGHGWYAFTRWRALRRSATSC